MRKLRDYSEKLKRVKHTFVLFTLYIELYLVVWYPWTKRKPMTINELNVVKSWFLYQMVAYFTMHTYGANQAFRFAKGILLHRESRQNRIKIGKDLFYIMYAASSELPSYVSTMG